MKSGENGIIPVWGVKWLIPGLGIIILLSVLFSVLFFLATKNAPPQDLKKRALKTLRSGTLSPHPFVRSAAAKAAGDSRDPAVLPWILLSMDDNDPMVRTFAVESAAGFKDPAAGTVLRRGLDDINLSVRLTTARVLNQYSGPGREMLFTRASNDPHPLVRLMALGKNFEGIPKKHMDSFREIFKSGSTQEKIVAATALGNTQSPDAIPVLGRLMTLDEDPSIRSFAARALGKISSVDSYPFLREGVRDESPEVRSESIQAIIGLEAFDPTLFLKQASNDPDEWVRLSAGLGFFLKGDDRYKKILEEALSSPDFGLRSAAARALGEMAREHPVKIPEDLFKALINGIHDPSERVRSASSRALGMIGETRALDPLEATLSDPDSSVRCYAAGAILVILSPGF